MSSSNRASLINQVIKVVKKQFKPAAVLKDRSLLEHLLFASCSENSTYEATDRVMQALTTEFFDWNEVRVSTIRELSHHMKPLNDPEMAATRLKRVLQSVFETHYSFDLEVLKKQNIGQAAKTIANYNGSTPYTVSFVTQHALGGHAIPVNNGLLECMRIVGVVSDAEADKHTIPGLDRSVPKAKGPETASLLHQLGVEMHRSPLGPNLRKLLLAIDPDCKQRLPKRQVAKKPDPEPPKASNKQTAGKSASAKEQPTPSPSGKKAAVSGKKAAASGKKAAANAPVSAKTKKSKPEKTAKAAAAKKKPAAKSNSKSTAKTASKSKSKTAAKKTSKSSKSTSKKKPAAKPTKKKKTTKTKATQTKKKSKPKSKPKTAKPRKPR